MVVGTAVVDARAGRAFGVAATAANGRGGRPVAVLAPRLVVARPRGRVDGRSRRHDRRQVHGGGVAACRRRAAERLGVMHFHGAND